MKLTKMELTDWSSIIPRLIILLGLICLFFFWLFYGEFSGGRLLLNEMVLVSAIAVLITNINSFYRVFFDDNAVYLQKYFLNKHGEGKIEYESITTIVNRRVFPPSFSYLEYNDGAGNINSVKLKISSNGWVNFSKQLKKRDLLEKLSIHSTS